MNEQVPHEEILSLIREIETSPASTQRTISQKLGISLGKTNYLLKELIKKGFIKARHFSTNPGRMEKINYILTPKGFQHMAHLTRVYLEIKEKEYMNLKKEWERVKSLKI